MTKRALGLSLLAIAGILGSGCGSAPAEDTSPLPPMDPQTRLKNASQKIAESNMTPEQKKAALEYVRQSVAQAEKIRSSAKAAGRPTG
jgi:hypothetical protein